MEAYQRDIPCRLPSIPVALNPNRSLLLIPGVVINFDAGLVISVGASILEYVLARAKTPSTCHLQPNQRTNLNEQQRLSPFRV